MPDWEIRIMTPEESKVAREQMQLEYARIVSEPSELVRKFGYLVNSKDAEIVNAQ